MWTGFIPGDNCKLPILIVWQLRVLRTEIFTSLEDGSEPEKLSDPWVCVLWVKFQMPLVTMGGNSSVTASKFILLEMTNPP